LEYFLVTLLISVFVLLQSYDLKNKYLSYIYYLIAIYVALAVGLKGNEDEYTRIFILIPNLEGFLNRPWIMLEKGIVFTFICSTLKTLGFNSQALFILFSGGGILFYAYYFKRFTNYYFLALFIYFCHGIQFKEFVALRMAFVSVMVLPMILLIIENKKIKFTVLLIFKTLIQYVGILSSILLFVNKKYNRRLIVLIFLGSIIIQYIGIIDQFFKLIVTLDYVPQVIRGYIGWDSLSYKLGILHPKILQQIIVIVLLLIFYERLGKNSKYFYPIFNTYFLSTVLFISFNHFALFATRFAGHFYSVEPIIMTYLFLIFKERRIILLISIIALLSISYINYVHLEKVEPYKLLIDQKNYDK